jgi:hypothetical protein
MDVDRFNKLMVMLILAIIYSAILALGHWDALADGLQQLYME